MRWRGCPGEVGRFRERAHPRTRERATPFPGFVLAALALAAPLGAVAQEVESGCVGCHLGLEEERLAAPARTYLEVDVHARQGFGCLECHGSGSPEERRLDPAAGFLSKPSRKRIPALCGRCHSNAAFMRDYDPSLRVDQVTEYLSSRHGLRLMQSDDADVATCVSCHPAHQIRPPSQPESSVHPLNVADLCGSCHADPEVMGSHDLPTNQAEAYRQSIHARLLYEDGDLSAPTCNDCHGNHGAAPPGVGSVRNVCGQCHVTMAEYFAGSAHVGPFEADDRPACATCHGNHDVQQPGDAALETRSREVCGSCHMAGDSSGGEFLAMKSLIDSLTTEAERSRAILLEAENRGMEVSTPLFELDDVGNALTKARAAIHTFHVAPVKAEIDGGFGITTRARERGQAALDEHRFRRVGLAFSVGIILIVIAGLVLKIRALEGASSLAPVQHPRERSGQA